MEKRWLLHDKVLPPASHACWSLPTHSCCVPLRLTREWRDLTCSGPALPKNEAASATGFNANQWHGKQHVSSTVGDPRWLCCKGDGTFHTEAPEDLILMQSDYYRGTVAYLMTSNGERYFQQGPVITGLIRPATPHRFPNAHVTDSYCTSWRRSNSAGSPGTNKSQNPSES